MRPDPFCDPGDDGQEPDGCLPPAGRDAEPAQQGLFLCLPAGSLDTDRFTQSGPAADMPPDPLLATIIDTVTGKDGKGLAGLSDDQLIGVIAAVRRLESRAAWYLMAAVGEFTARNTGEGCVEEFAADQLAHELHLTVTSAAAQMDYASTVTSRLPATYAALHAGTIHPVHARIIEEETRILSGKDAAKADAVLAEAAGSLTFGKLRSTAHRLVLELDPESAERRKETARQDAHVRRFREESGNAGMVARELPPDEVLASWQHVEQRALDLRAADIPGTLQELRVQAYLDLLQERDSRCAPADPDASTGRSTGPAHAADDPGPDGNPGPASDGNDGSSGPGSHGGPSYGPASGAGGSGRPPARPGGRAQLRRAGEHHRAVGGADRPAGRPGRRGRVRVGRRRRRPRPGRRRGTRSPHSLVRDRAAPRRDRRRPRLRRWPAPAARHRRRHRHPRTRPTTRHPPTGLDRPPAYQDDPDRPRHLRPRPRRTRLPAQPQAPAPGQGA